MRTLKDLDFKDKKVLIRCDFNVPIENGQIVDDLRIVASIPTIEEVLKAGGAVILMSHLGRPKGKPSEEFSLKPVAERLEDVLNKKVIFAKSDRVVDGEVEEIAKNLRPGDVMLLENLRFRAEEEKNDEGFAKELASLGDLFINDAFGTSHRSHASNVGVSKFLPSALGLLVEKEVSLMSKVLKDPKRPFVVILGGAKIADKISVIENLIDKVDTLLIGGAMANTFIKAEGYGVGKSLVDDDNIQFAQDMVKRAADRGAELIIPKDVVVAEEISDNLPYKTVQVSEIPDNLMALDIGNATIKEFSEIIKKAKTVVWNGPMGVFESENFSRGTFSIARAIAESDAFSVVGGGDSASACEQSGYAHRITHISTGGGASLEFLEGKTLPGVAAAGGEDA